MDNAIIGFNIYEQLEPTNNDITISFNPDPSYSSYKLIVIKDEQIYKEITKINLSQTKLTLSETGTYTINVIYYDMYMNEYNVSSGIYKIDKEAPILNISKNYIEISLGSKLDIMNGVSANDNFEGNLTNSITTNSSTIDFNTKGSKKLIYTVSDRAGNITEQEVIVNITKSRTSVFIFQAMFTLILAIIVLAIIIYNKSTKLEKRISRFSISPLKDTSLSLFDTIGLMIRNVIDNINKVLYKSEFIKKYSRRYTKYIRTTNQNSMNFIAIKVISSILCVIIAILAKTLQFKIFNIYDIYIPLLFGFFIPDFVYSYKYKTYQRKLENDLLQAIIIMNNAFKSGRSIVQAIDLVSKELDGPMAEEFKKMHLELSFGLGLDIVFNRFSERIKIEEVAYLTASLTILNKTGGNIVEVFSSIEKSLFNKKKLRLELRSLTSSSKIIVNILTIVPPAFILFIAIINPTYFVPLFTNTLGYIIINIVLIYYVLYIILIRKLLKVKI